MSLTFFEPGYLASGYAKLIQAGCENIADILRQAPNDEQPLSVTEQRDMLNRATEHSRSLSKKHFDAFARCKLPELVTLVQDLRKFVSTVMDPSLVLGTELDSAISVRLLEKAVRKPSDIPLLLELFNNPAAATCLDDFEIENVIFHKNRDSVFNMGQVTAFMLDEHPNRPYFKIYPDYAEMFRKTRLDVPIESFVLPYPVFDIVFSRESPLQIEGRSFFGMHVCSLQANETTNRWELRPTDSENPKYRLTCLLYGDMTVNWVKSFVKSSILNKMSAEHRAAAMPLFIEFNIDPALKSVEAAIRDFVNMVDNTLDENTKKNNDSEEFVTSSQRLKSDLKAAIDVCSRIILSVSFLHRGFDADLLEPDFLSKDLQPYLDAIQKKDEKKIVAIREKADKERGKKGVAIGKSDYLLGRRYIIRDVKEDECVDENQEKPEKTRELTYCHMRSPHFRMVRVGKGRTEFRSKFIRQVIVRKDLPPKPSSGPIGFSTPKEKK